MITMEQAQSVLAEIDAGLAKLGGRDAEIHAALSIVHRNLPHYKWIGLYLLDGGVLNLGPYIGPATEHTLISVGKGVCGQAVSANQDIVVEDVRTQDNSLAGSAEIRAEIAALIREAQSGQILGLIDADGDVVGTFDKSDAALLHAIGERLAPHLWRVDD